MTHSHKLLLLLCCFTILITSQISAQDCDNPLLTTYNFTALSSPEDTTDDFKYCKSLTQTCCSADTVNGFKEKANDLIARLTESVAKRDIFLVDIRTKVIPKLQNKFQSLKNHAEKAIKTLNKKNNKGEKKTHEKGDTSDTTETTDNTEAIAMIQKFGDMKDQLGNLVPKAKSEFAHFQQLRAKCIVKLVKIQAAAWCLACDPDYSSKGITAGSLELSHGLKQSLISSCLKYFTHSEKQNRLLSFSYLSDSLDTLITGLKSIANGTQEDTGDFESAAIDSEFNSMNVTEETQKPVYFPANCTEDSCDWIELALFVAGEIKEDLLAAGGSFYEEDEGSDDEEEDDDEETEDDEETRRLLRGRMLQSGWNPDVNEAGIDVQMQINPGGVDNSSAWRQGAFVSGLLCLLITLLF